MCFQWAISHAAPLESWAKIFGIVLGGGWVLYRFGLRRKGETALDIALSCETLKVAKVPPDEAQYLVTFDVTLANKGAVKIAAKKKLVPDLKDATTLVAYQDKYERLRYPIDLMVRRITAATNTDNSIRWFPVKDSTSPLPTDLQLDLLSDYELDGKYTFWMEPKETYHLSASCHLAAGDYLVMATFVGEREDKDFWRRTFVVRVPQVDAPSA